MTRPDFVPPLIEHKFPLRPDLTVHMTLPADLTVSDAARIATWVRTLAFPDPPDDEEGVSP